MDIYKNKYLKYKQKYINLKNLLNGGDDKYDEICDFTKYKQIGAGAEGTIYKINDKAYKVIPIRRPQLMGAWGIKLNGGGMLIEEFNRSCENYKKASDLNLGPKFYGCYTCENKGVIVMDYIDGITLDKLKEQNQSNYNTFTKIKEKYIQKLRENNIIPEGILEDAHDANFILSNEGRLYAIDF